MQQPSRNSAGAIYLNKAARIDELRAAARRARERMPSIRRVVLFGSLVSGIPTPRSDADLLVIVEGSEHSAARDRLPDVLRVLAPLGGAVDLHVITAAELEQSQRDADPLIREAGAHGIDLL